MKTFFRPQAEANKPRRTQPSTAVRRTFMMEDAAANEAEHGLEPEPEPQPFSVVLAPPATVSVQRPHRHGHVHGHGHGGSGVLVRYLCARKPPPPPPPQQQHHARDRAGSRGGKQPSSGLSSIIVSVRAQPHALHLYRGRKLRRVVEFPSAVADVAGLPRGSPAAAVASADTLCVVVCRNGVAYALPTAEVLEGAERGGDAMTRKHSGKAEHKLTATGPGGGGGGGGDAALGTARSGASERKPGSRSSSSSAAVGIFDELAPTILDDSQDSFSQELAATQKHEDVGGSGSGSGGGVSLGGLVIQAQERWAVFTHPGVRTVSVCGDGATTAVAGIIDRAAAYCIAAGTNNGGGAGTSAAAGRRLGALAGVDGTAPTTSCTVWIEDGSRGGSALGDGKGFPLPSPVFRSLFGGALSTRPFSQPVSGSAAAGDADGCSKSAFAVTASVVLIGDTAGTVRWSPVPPRPGFPGGVLATLPGEATAIVAVLPQLDAESRAVGVLLVGANGAVLDLAATTAGAASSGDRVSRKRPRPDDAGGHERRDGGCGNACGATDRGVTPPQSWVSRRLLGLPFPVASACSVPGFLVHCHAGALFATAVPATTAGGGEQDDARPAASFDTHSPKTPGCSNHVAAPALPLRPVRLPLPCNAVGVAVAPVLADGDEVGKSGKTAPALPAGAAGGASSAVRQRTLVMSLSGQGRLVGFVAPQSAEELEGWRLDAGRGGVRVGSGAGVERRVRGQLERLSSLGRQCAALSAESAERDREIGVLRGATVLLPPLVASAGRRILAGGGGGGGGGAPASSECLAHSISMAPDTQEAAAGFADCYGGGQGPGHSDALQVRLCVRLWPRERGRARGDLQAVGGDDGGGRWFIVTRIVAGGGAGYSGGGGGGGGELSGGIANEDGVGEGWAWATSALVPMGSLHKGWPWSSSVAVTLPSARPVTATSWLQFRFDADGGHGGGGGPVEGASGACVELGSSRFDVLDWGVKLPSVPRSAAAVRAASRGPGASFCGPELAIAGVLEGCPSPSSSSSPSSFAGGGCASTGSIDGALQAGAAAARPAVPAAWSSFRLRLASPDRGAGALLSLLVPAATAPPPPPASGRNGGGGGGGGGGGARAEIAVRVAGQVAIIRATDCAAAAAAAGEGEVHGRARAPAGSSSRGVELAVTCSHAAMAPLVREALLSRARLLLAVPTEDGRGSELSGGGGGGESGGTGRPFCGGVVSRGDAAARLVREIHPIKQAVADAGDAARALGAARASDGPSVESSAEALALMRRVGEIYQTLRRRQESVGYM